MATTTSAIVAIVAIISDVYRFEALEVSTIIAINKGLLATIDRLEQIRINTFLTFKKSDIDDVIPCDQCFDIGYSGACPHGPLSIVLDSPVYSHKNYKTKSTYLLTYFPESLDYHGI